MKNKISKTIDLKKMCITIFHCAKLEIESLKKFNNLAIIAHISN